MAHAATESPKSTQALRRSTLAKSPVSDGPRSDQRPALAGTYITIITMIGSCTIISIYIVIITSTVIIVNIIIRVTTIILLLV